MKWPLIHKMCDLIGYTNDAIKTKISNGVCHFVWVENFQFNLIKEAVL